MTAQRLLDEASRLDRAIRDFVPRGERRERALDALGRRIDRRQREADERTDFSIAETDERARRGFEHEFRANPRNR